ncbi:hypothetical protein [Pseudomarimonas arenosa]|uniref:Replication protein n=1 Tax=Pseudomarimonas arenosa TaxID=2774145 RepID=A0AAW3ZEH8_9GAMM|nr:hypothetical protein [Pseudomarimonas arenosa]MBD8524119.1 hypothetical protein [Pseudomarimonas arenosa]
MTAIAPRKQPTISDLKPTALQLAILRRDIETIRRLAAVESERNKMGAGGNALTVSVHAYSRAVEQLQTQSARFYEAVVQLLLNAGMSCSYGNNEFVSAGLPHIPRCLREANAAHVQRWAAVDPYLTGSEGNQMEGSRFEKWATRNHDIHAQLGVEVRTADIDNDETVSDEDQADELRAWRLRYTRAQVEGRPSAMLAKRLEEAYELAPGALRRGGGPLPSDDRFAEPQLARNQNPWTGFAAAHIAEQAASPKILGAVERVTNGTQPQRAQAVGYLRKRYAVLQKIGGVPAAIVATLEAHYHVDLNRGEADLPLTTRQKAAQRKAEREAKAQAQTISTTPLVSIQRKEAAHGQPISQRNPFQRALAFPRDRTDRHAQVWMRYRAELCHA